MFFDFKTVLAVTAVFHVFSNLSKIALFRSGIDKNIVLKLGIPAVIFVTLGAVLTNYIDAHLMPVVFNAVLVGIAVYLIVNFGKRLAQTDTNLVIGGCASGFTAGVAGTGGAIRGITLAAFGLPKSIYIATSAMIDLGVDLSRSAVYLYNGYFPVSQLLLIPLLIVVSFAGSYAGKHILVYVSEKLFRYITLGIIIVTAIASLIHYFF
jgi:uncharacterized membrane protein YfcA